MRVLRRLVQAVALVGTLLVAVIAVALIVSQTPWFRDWLRRYIVRESKQYLNGELTIGRLGGNLFFGVDLTDVAVDVSGSRVLAVKGLELDYNVFHLISQGVVLDEIKLVEPRLRVERDDSGWNVGSLVKARRREADREGPGRPITLQSIEIADGSLAIDDRSASNGYQLPDRIEDLDVRAAFDYEPVHYSLDLEHVSFRATGPQLSLEQLTGAIAVRGDDLHIERLAVRTGDSSVTIDGVVQDYLASPVLRLTTSGSVSLPEVGRIVPAASGYSLRPAFDVKANGPAERLALDLDVKSEAGDVRGQVTADVKAPGVAAQGDLRLNRLNLAPILKDPQQRTDLTGEVRLDVRMASEPANAPALTRTAGTFSFSGPRVAAAGYEATNVRASGAIREGRITLDARVDAYGGTATAAGFIRPPASRRPLAFDLQGQAERVNLQSLPASTGAPRLRTDLSVAEYRIRGEGRAISGRAMLNRSQVEGATFAQGTVAEFATNAGTVSYAAKGEVSGLDLPRLGRALKVGALNKPLYEGRVNGRFDVAGAGTELERMTLDASGNLTDTEIAGARLNAVAFETHLKDGSLAAQVKGGFADLDPAHVSGRPALGGRVSGTVDARVQVATITEPITPERLTARGQVRLESSSIGGLQIDRAAVEGEYARLTGDLSTLEVAGPDLNVTASGRLALDRESSSALKYHVETTDLAALGKIAGQEGLDGSATLDGTLTGNAASLQTTGTLDASNLTYRENSALDVNSTYTVTVPELTPADATVEATTDATFVKAGGLELNEVTAKTTYTDKQLDFDTSLKQRTRELDAAGQVVFHPDHQELHLPRFAVRTQGVEWQAAPGSEAAIQYGQGRIAFQDVRLVSGDQSLDVSGALALDGEERTGALEVKAANVDLAQLEQLLMQDRGLSGRLTADATVSGTAKKPLVDGRVEIQQGGFRTYRYESLVADVDYGTDRIELDARLQQSPTEAITARGTVPMSLFVKGEGGHVAASAEDRLDLRIQSTDLGLGFIEGFTTQVTNVTGRMQADVRLTGSGSDPHLEGHVDIREGAFGIPLGGVSYRGLDTRIDLEPDVVRIREFRILDEHGEGLTVSGQLAVHERQVGAVDVSLTSDNFEVIDNELGDVGIDSQLKITGELRRPRIEGQVRLEAARVEVDRVLRLFYDPYAVESLPAVVSAERSVEGTGSAEEATRDALARAERSAAPPAAAEGPADAPPAAGGPMAPVAIDVRLVIPDNLVLRGSDLRPGGPTGAALGDVNITVGGDLHVRKQPNGPVTLVGTVNTVRGTYDFQGRRFDLVRGGTLRFTGDPQPNPLLDVSATRDIPNTGVQARIHVGGTAKTPELELTSTPPLEESDILSLIVFNRPVNELGTGERASLAATAGGIATGFIAAPLGESIGRALDLDLFEITTTTEEGELGAGVTIGQQVGDRAFLKLRQQFGRQNTSEFLIEYQLFDFLRLQATAAPETSGSANRLGQRRVERAGIDLIFFFSY